MNSNINVYNFNKISLQSIISKASDNHFDAIQDKPQFLYLLAYLQNEDTRYTIVEQQYIDYSYLEDYGEYYVRNYHNYRRFCVRLHFFKKIEELPLDNTPSKELEENFLDFFLENQKKCQESYLGYLVVKPISNAPFGKLCLATYGKEVQLNQADKTDKRFFLTKTVRSNLLGTTLSIDTIPAQEQDSIISACVTSTLWSYLHTINKETTDILSMSAITKIIENKKSLLGKAYGDSNFNLSLIRTFVNYCKLEFISHDFYEGKSIDFLKESVIAYQSYKKEAIILAVKVFDDNNTELNPHLVLITGYGCNKNGQLSKLYIHDDQLGPFARLKFVDDDYLEPIINIDGESNQYKYKATGIYLGLYSKIRLKFNDLFDKKSLLKDILSCYLPDSIKLNIVLIDSNQYKANILKKLTTGTGISPILKKLYKTFLKNNQPKYLWKISVINGADTLLDILIDTTEGEFSDKALMDVLWHDLPSQEFNIKEELIDETEGLSRKDKFFLKKLIRLLNKRQENLNFIDLLYGNLKPFARLHGDEINEQENIQQISDNEKIIIILGNEKNEKIENLDQNKTYIWVMNDDCHVIITQDSESQHGYGHPILNNGEHARLAGELFYKDEQWILNNASGRYSRAYKISVQALESCVDLLYRSGFIKKRFTIKATLFIDKKNNSNKDTFSKT